MQISEKLLNEKVMSMLKARDSSTDARSIFLELVTDKASACNWRIGHFDPGNGDRYKCKVALRAIYQELGSDYEMVGYS